MVHRIQTTLIRIDHYGPWTGTLGSDREYQLQALQARLYADLQEMFARKGGLLFSNRYDEMIAVTNGISLEDHRAIQAEVNRSHPVTLSMGVGIGTAPYEAQLEASKAIQRVGSARSAHLKGVLAGNSWLRLDDGEVGIGHMDINDSTSHLTDTLSAYEGSIMLRKLHLRLSEAFITQASLLFYCGGDNFMAVSSGMHPAFYNRVLQEVHSDLGIGLKVGIGIARVGRRAAALATEGLDMIRRGAAEPPIKVLSDIEHSE